MTQPPLQNLPSRVSIREVGPRDGLQSEDVILTTDQKVALINQLATTGLEFIEVGSFVRPQNVPQMADTAEVFARIERRPGIIYSAIGIPRSMFTVMFAIARTVGWVAHWQEMIADPAMKIGRPRQLYTGPAKRDYIEMNKR